MSHPWDYFRNDSRIPPENFELPEPYGDVALYGLKVWIESWRMHRTPRTPLPPLSFAAHLGTDAVTLMGGGLDHQAIGDRMFPLGRFGTCPCGRNWTGLDASTLEAVPSQDTTDQER